MGEYNEELLSYVKSQLNSGFPFHEIKDALLSQGWSEAEINDTIVEAKVQNEAKAEEKKENPREGSVPERKRALVGFSVSIIGGLLMLIDPLFAIVTENFTPIFSTPSLYQFAFSNYLGIALGILTVLGSALLLRGRTGAGGLAVLLFSALNALLVSVNLGFIVGIVGGLIGLSKK